MNSYPSKIKDLPEQERPRERLMEYGASNISTSELLAILLRSGSEGKSALTLANQLLEKYGSLRSLSNATIEELQDIRGIGPAKASQLEAGITLAVRLAKEQKQEQPQFESPDSVYQYVRLEIRDAKREIFMSLMLDGKKKLIRQEHISKGTLTSSLVHPREVFRPAIRSSAAALIFAHNHPSGDPSPSKEDIDITERLRDVGELIGIRVLDHIIVGDQTYTSLSQQNYVDFE